MNGISNRIRKLASRYNRQYPDWRSGQSIFNAAYKLYPEKANKLRTTDFDCFYKDDKIKIFLEKIDSL